jgi:hypothetical protein
VVVVASETEKRRLRRCCVGLRRSLAMLRGQITSEVSNCEGCVVSGLPPPGFELQISRLPEKVVIPLDRPGPPVY